MKRGLGFMSDNGCENIHCNDSKAHRRSSILQLLMIVQHARVGQGEVGDACFRQANQSKRVGHGNASLELGPSLHRTRGKIATSNTMMSVIRFLSLLWLSLHCMSGLIRSAK